MALAARLVLTDCEKALEELNDCDVDLETSLSPMRRRRWMAIVALLRAVGHVLKNVDGASNPTLGRIIKAEWDAVTKTKRSLTSSGSSLKMNVILSSRNTGSAHIVEPPAVV